MNKTIYNFPRVNRLTCTWIETGDPRQPLARVWIDSDINFLNAADALPAEAEVEGTRLCA